MGNFVKRANSPSTPAFAKDARELHTVSLIYDRTGNRKYLTISERNAFLKAAARMPPEVHSFCTLLAYSGARLSEVLAIPASRIDLTAGLGILESLKKRRDSVFLVVTVPSD